MKYPISPRCALLAAVLGAGSVLAQTSPSATSPGSVVSDVAPLPAEERASVGAVVLENSLVRAQRERAFQRSAARTGVASIGRGVLRATRAKQTQADLASVRLNEALEFQDRGASSLDGK